jgi:hypothetical protein
MWVTVTGDHVVEISSSSRHPATIGAASPEETTPGTSMPLNWLLPQIPLAPTFPGRESLTPTGTHRRNHDG